MNPVQEEWAESNILPKLRVDVPSGTVSVTKFNSFLTGDVEWDTLSDFYDIEELDYPDLQVTNRRPSGVPGTEGTVLHLLAHAVGPRFNDVRGKNGTMLPAHSGKTHKLYDMLIIAMCKQAVLHPGAMAMRNANGMQPIHVAAGSSQLHILKQYVLLGGAGSYAELG